MKQGKKITKFKLRKAKYLYTFKTDKQAMAKKILDSLANSNIQKVELKGKRVLRKKTGKKWSTYLNSQSTFRLNIPHIPQTLNSITEGLLFNNRIQYKSFITWNIKRVKHESVLQLDLSPSLFLIKLLYFSSVSFMTLFCLTIRLEFILKGVFSLSNSLSVFLVSKLESDFLFILLISTNSSSNSIFWRYFIYLSLNSFILLQTNSVYFCIK